MGVSHTALEIDVYDLTTPTNGIWLNSGNTPSDGSTMKHGLLVLATVCATLGAASAESAQTIKKCQDEDGKWYYGDQAAEVCARSRITEINDRGLKVDETLPLDEVEAARKQKEADRSAEIRAREQKVKDQRVLAMYDSEQAIVYSRDQRLNSIDNYIAIHQELLDRLVVNLKRMENDAGASPTKQEKKQILSQKSQIADYEAAIAARTADRETEIVRFEGLLANYRGALDRTGRGTQ